ncbi:hypothetical protein FOZ63_033412 [Perkinsus olseni]|uniref:JmjC domain-containing protein n=1 Tax=Perkinsus olseni TaxID=32597 RepID=A0A7J6U331_PEROL|nr:hypothetical protein FOZ63_033412 [Perkinsus olseni]
MKILLGLAAALGVTSQREAQILHHLRFDPDGLGGMVEYESASMISEEKFVEHINRGDVVVVRGVAREWPITGSKCSDFCGNEQLQGIEIEKLYGDEDGTFVPLYNDECWDKPNKTTADGQTSPRYWAVRDTLDAHPKARRWISESTRLPEFMPTQGNENLFEIGSEIWFTPEGSGAKAHADSHPQATAAFQLSGERIWRLASMPEFPHATLRAHLYDSTPFQWAPEVEVTIGEGDGIFIPPGIIHETGRSVDAPRGCVASLTVQFDNPLPFGYYRRHMAAIRKTGDGRNMWRLLLDLASGGYLAPSMKSFPFIGLGGASSYNATGPHIFAEMLPKLLSQKGPGPLTTGWTRESIALGVDPYNLFHDIDGDGKASAEEITRTFLHWHEVEMRVLQQTPEAARSLHYFPKYPLTDRIDEFEAAMFDEYLARSLQVDDEL